MPMNQPEHDEQNRFEKRLREFRPAAPRPLAIPVRRVPWGRLAVAAVLLVAIALTIVMKRARQTAGTAIMHKDLARPPVASPVTLGKLNAALRASDQDLNRMLDDASPRLLPQSHRGTALFELGKE